jgi:5-oxoprolinase (ATP-hydrolysing)
MKLVPRGDTTVVDAYLSPILRRYVDRVAAQMPGVRLFFMQSSGGLTEAHHFQGKDAILSGPAGGIVGMVRTAVAAGHPKVIGFDMGGTSTDVSHYAGEFERAFETQVAGVRMRAPMMSIHTVAAGGGSLLGFDGARLRVGPQSAGCQSRPGLLPPRRAAGHHRRERAARPHPARLVPARLRAGGRCEPLDHDAVVARFAALAAEVQAASGREMSVEALAEGFLQIAIQNMAGAIKRISVARGYDVTQYTLQCFGGAGGQHACGVADALGMPRILVHPLAGVLSAYGMGLADQIAMREASVERRSTRRPGGGAHDLGRAGRCGRGRTGGAGCGADGSAAPRAMHLRYEGTDTALLIDAADEADAAALRVAFDSAYRQRFAFLMPDRAAGHRGGVAGSGGRGRGARRHRRRGPVPCAPAGARDPCAHALRPLARRRAAPARATDGRVRSSTDRR